MAVIFFVGCRPRKRTIASQKMTQQMMMMMMMMIQHMYKVGNYDDNSRANDRGMRLGIIAKPLLGQRPCLMRRREVSEEFSSSVTHVPQTLRLITEPWNFVVRPRRFLRSFLCFRLMSIKNILLSSL